MEFVAHINPRIEQCQQAEGPAPTRVLRFGEILHLLAIEPKGHRALHPLERECRVNMSADDAPERNEKCVNAGPHAGLEKAADDPLTNSLAVFGVLASGEVTVI